VYEDNKMQRAHDEKVQAESDRKAAQLFKAREMAKSEVQEKAGAITQKAGTLPVQNMPETQKNNDSTQPGTFAFTFPPGVSKKPQPPASRQRESGQPHRPSFFRPAGMHLVKETPGCCLRCGKIIACH
jgi:hypothetical protein